MVVPTDYGLVLKKLELPSVEEFQQRVEERAETVDLSMEEVNELVQDARNDGG
jgi:antitoxin PrlF